VLDGRSGGSILVFRSGLVAFIGALLLALGASSALLVYAYEMQSVKKKRAKHEYRINAAFEGLHCRDNRVAEFDDNGFTFSCSCGQVTRPWSELLRFSESDTAFFLATKDEGHVIPKSAFASEGVSTEFRALVVERIEQQRTMREIRGTTNLQLGEPRTCFMMQTAT